tara:strand:+ start:243 stop:833 length:591 start_codon:yes stop_codon:yes gene_type:complete
MKIEKVLTFGVVGYALYHFFLKKPATEVVHLVEEEVDTILPDDGEPKTSFRYNGMSALRSDGQGMPLPCGQNGNPFTSQGIEGKFTKKQDLVAPTTFFAVLNIGSSREISQGITPSYTHGLRVGDELQLSVNGGQFTALDGQVVTILQLGTDNCTSDGQIQNPKTSVVIDVPIIIEGASDWQYPSMEAFGTFFKIN